jgi:hypothetical protein
MHTFLPMNFAACFILVSQAAALPLQDVTASQVIPAPPTNLVATDHPWDGGTAIDLTWDLSSDDAQIETYQVLRAIARVGNQDIEAPDFKHVEYVAKGTSEFVARDLRRSMDRFDIADQLPNVVDLDALLATGDKKFPVAYHFQVIAVHPDGGRSQPAVTAAALVPTMEPVDGARVPLFIILLIFGVSVVFWILHARQGKPIKIRKIAGLEAVDEAVGRATEMGRSCLFVPGIQDMNEIQTIAGITILARVAKTAAEYNAKVEVPTSKSLVMTACREAVQAAYLEAGRPDAYHQDLVYYVTDEQFGYVAYLQGMMVREKPAACFYMGSFFAESLILAETGNSIGAIQVAGTAQPAQLPFFVAACDYTLIGEEFFAASAYLSGSPEEIGSLKGQDMGKLIVGVVLLIGVGMITVASVMGADSHLGDGLRRAVDFLQRVILA